MKIILRNSISSIECFDRTPARYWHYYPEIEKSFFGFFKKTIHEYWQFGVFEGIIFNSKDEIMNDHADLFFIKNKVYLRPCVKFIMNNKLEYYKYFESFDEAKKIQMIY